MSEDVRGLANIIRSCPPAEVKAISAVLVLVGAHASKRGPLSGFAYGKPAKRGDKVGEEAKNREGQSARKTEAGHGFREERCVC